MPDHPDLVFELALDRYLDQVLQGDREDALPEGLDVGLAATVRRLEAVNHAPVAEAGFADRLLDHLIGTSDTPSDHHPNQPGSPRTPRWVRQRVIARQEERETPMLSSLTIDPSQPLARSGRSAAFPQPGWSRTWRAVTQLTTVALLLLTIVMGLVMFGVWRPGAPEPPLSHLAASNAQTPMVATPAASPQAPAPLAEFVTEIRLGTGPSNSPAGMAVDADGTLYVIDALQDQIRLFDPSGQPVVTWGETGTEPGQFRFHGEGGFWGDLALGPDGNLYVLDSFNNRIQVLGPDGTVVREWGEAGGDEGQFLEPVGIAIAPDGRVFVADTDNSRVQIFNANGQFLEAWIASGDAKGLPSSPANIEVDAAGFVSVTDWNTNAIIRLDATGTLLNTLGTAEAAPPVIAGPWGMASDDKGNLFVADGPGNRIQVFAPDGTLLGTIGGVGVQPGQFIIPKYVALSADGLLYVAEEGNRRIQVFRLLPPVWP